jgi:hypothetical protein
VNTAVVTPRAPAAGYVFPNNNIPVTATGPGTGSFSPKVIDLDSLRDNQNFRVEFADSAAFHNNPNPFYRLIDVTTGDTVFGLTRLKGPQEVSTVMRGFNFTVSNDQFVTIDLAKTGWKNKQINTLFQVGFDSRFAPAYQVQRVNYPADFEITFTQKGQGDLSFPGSSFTGPQPSNVTIRNLTENTDHVQFIFQDVNADSVFDAGDAIFIVYGDSTGKRATAFPSAKKSWSVTLIKDTTIADSLQRPPQPGDVFYVATKKPFRTGESISFTTVRAHFDASKAIQDMGSIAVVPNPYVGAASWEPAPTSAGRGERRIFFIHLPQQCTIRIYTISGHLVQTIQHNGTFSDGQESWNLVSRDGMDIAFGVYVYQVEAVGIGTRIDRFAVLK